MFIPMNRNEILSLCMSIYYIVVKGVPFQRVVVRGRTRVAHAYRVNKVLLKQRLLEKTYHVHETQHFMFFLGKRAFPKLIVYWFAPEEIIDSWLACCVSPCCSYSTAVR